MIFFSQHSLKIFRLTLQDPHPMDARHNDDVNTSKRNLHPEHLWSVRSIWSGFLTYVFFFLTRCQFWPPGIVVACVCLVHVYAHQSLACPRDNSRSNFVSPLLEIYNRNITTRKSWVPRLFLFHNRTVSWSPSSVRTYIIRLFHGPECFTVSTLCTYTDLGSRGYFSVYYRSCFVCFFKLTIFWIFFNRSAATYINR